MPALVKQFGSIHIKGTSDPKQSAEQILAVVHIGIEYIASGTFWEITCWH